MIKHKVEPNQNIKYKKLKMLIEARDNDQVTNNLFNEIMEKNKTPDASVISRPSAIVYV